MSGAHHGPRVVLAGLPGSGKSTVGRALAGRLGVGFLDSDAAVEQRTGLSVPECFRRHGEAWFREREHEAILHSLDEHDGVLALGGGAVLDPRTRAALAAHRVVLLEVSDAEALARLRDSGERPLLAEDPGARLAALRAERAPLYAEVAAATVSTTGRSPEEVAAEIAALLPTRIRVGDDGGYDVVIGAGLEADVVRAVLAAPRPVRALVAHAPATEAIATSISSALEAAGVRAVPHELPDAEDAKTLEAVAACWDRLGAERFGREDVVLAVGGGATTDVAGFVAATWLRGVRLVNVPTTLLGMVDAAVGGKTGINTHAGKNLVGSFHPPSAVVCDLRTLATLPAPDLRAGLAEVVKCGFIADERILGLIEEDHAQGTGAVLDARSPVLRELVERAVAVKARVVGEDLREAGLREILNYGHTFGHAIERVEGYRWRHGDAVAVGMVFVAELARAAGMLDEATVARHRDVLTALGLPTTYRNGSWEELRDAMASDKKVRGDALRFVVLAGVGQPTILRAPEPEHLQAAYRAVAGDPGTGPRSTA